MCPGRVRTVRGTGLWAARPARCRGSNCRRGAPGLRSQAPVLSLPERGEGANHPALASWSEEENSFLTLAEIINFTLGKCPKIHPIKHLHIGCLCTKTSPGRNRPPGYQPWGRGPRRTNLPWSHHLSSSLGRKRVFLLQSFGDNRMSPGSQALQARQGQFPILGLSPRRDT